MLGKRITDALWWLPVGRVDEIDPAALHRLLERESPPQLIDVRTEAEWRSDHIRDAVSVPITDLRQRFASLELDPNRAVVAICLSAHRSIPAVRWLTKRGFPSVMQLQGGMRAWWAAGLPTER